MLTRNELFAALAISQLTKERGRAPNGLAICERMAQCGYTTTNGNVWETLATMKRRGELTSEQQGKRKGRGGKAPICWAITGHGRVAMNAALATLDALRGQPERTILPPGWPRPAMSRPLTKEDYDWPGYGAEPVT